MLHLIVPILPHIVANMSVFTSHATYVMGWLGNGSDGVSFQGFGFGIDFWVEF